MPREQGRKEPGARADNATPREKELLERIRQLEEMNSTLQDKLDMIWSILEPDYELPADDNTDESTEGDGGLVQIQGLK